VQHSAVSNTEARRRIRGVEDCPHLADREVSHQRLVMALCRMAWICLICSGRRDAEFDVRMNALIAASRELRVVASL
jgi:hypothetical protein